MAALFLERGVGAPGWQDPMVDTEIDHPKGGLRRSCSIPTKSLDEGHRGARTSCGKPDA